MGIAAEADRGDTRAVARPDVHLVDNHDEAYHIWRRAGVSGRTLVHVDAHHDMAWVGPDDLINIGNYVCQAMQDGIVAQVFWVTPDASWSTDSNRRILRRHLRTLIAQYPGEPGRIRTEHRRITARLLDVPVTICALDSLPDLTRAVLLDVDVDFFMLPTVEYFRDERPLASPWVWPDDLQVALRRKKAEADIVTIAYSVAGGYVPIEWKYLGDELALGWTQDPEESIRRSGFRLLREAATADDRAGALLRAGQLQQAAAWLPKSAAPHLRLAALHLEAGELERARAEFQLAAEADVSCRGPHATRGLVCLSEGRNAEAEAEFRRILTLDANNPFGLLGLGRVAVLQRRWTEAERWLRSAIGVEPNLIDAHRYLGDVLVAQGRDDEAALAYSRSLKLALAGEVSTEEALHTEGLDAGRRDGRHDRFHAALAAIDARAGRLSAAAAGYQMALAARPDRLAVKLRLALVYFRQGRTTRAIQMAALAIAQTPAASARAMRHAIRRAGRWLMEREPRRRR